jgi:hypothetical protein
MGQGRNEIIAVVIFSKNNYGCYHGRPTKTQRNRFLIEATPSTLSSLQGSMIFGNYAGRGV